MTTTIDFPTFARDDRVATEDGYAGTVVAGNSDNPYATIRVALDKDGSDVYAEPATLTKLATRKRTEAVRGGVHTPRAWTMGGGVD